MFYQRLIRPILFALSARDPERAHEWALKVLKFLGAHPILAEMIGSYAQVTDLRLAQTILGMRFSNPVGLAAGFDKNGIVLRGLQALGFGFLEMGSITQHEQPGNPRPRMFRFLKDQALINRMGFNNHGADKVCERLWEMGKPGIPLGISLGKSKRTPLERAVDDYLYTFRKLYRFADYIAVNVSSPNTPGLRALQDRRNLEVLLGVLMNERTDLSSHARLPRKPIFVKLAPDLTWEAIDEVLEVCLERGVDGLIATNTTITHDGLSVSTQEAGGMSGGPLFTRARDVVRHMYCRTEGKLPIIGVGGIMNPEDAWNMITAGASLIQVFTGFVYKGPFFPRQINLGLLRWMESEGIKHISEVIGACSTEDKTLEFFWREREVSGERR